MSDCEYQDDAAPKGCKLRKQLASCEKVRAKAEEEVAFNKRCREEDYQDGWDACNMARSQRVIDLEKKLEAVLQYAIDDCWGKHKIKRIKDIIGDREAEKEC